MSIAPHSTCLLLLLFRRLRCFALLAAAVFGCLLLLLPAMRTAIPYDLCFLRGDLEHGESATDVSRLLASMSSVIPVHVCAGGRQC